MKQYPFKAGFVILTLIFVGGIAAVLIRRWHTEVESIFDREITAQIEDIKAPSLPSYGAELLIDGVAKDVNAWHGPQNPQYPINIDVRFERKVFLERVAFQAQLGPFSNMSRAPKIVVIYGGPDFDHLKELTVLNLEFSPTTKPWSFHSLPRMDYQQPCYRIKILSNSGNQGCVTLQEMKFYGSV